MRAFAGIGVMLLAAVVSGCESADQVQTHPGNHPAAMKSSDVGDATYQTPLPDRDPPSPRFNDLDRDDLIPVLERGPAE